jgi:hypothetical protein
LNVSQGTAAEWFWYAWNQTEPDVRHSL